LTEPDAFRIDERVRIAFCSALSAHSSPMTAMRTP